MGFWIRGYGSGIGKIRIGRRHGDAFCLPVRRLRRVGKGDFCPLWACGPFTPEDT